jgi:hypothetical protein
MIQKLFENINKDDLLSLVYNAVLEKKTLEYKQEFSGNGDQDRKEFLKDITSFANSSGGDIIYGIKEENGVPIELLGIPKEEVDAKIRWIEDLVRQGIQPRISGMKIQPIEISASNSAVIIRVPKSWRSPHCVTLKNWSRFFARSSNGVYQLDVDELRSSFIQLETINEKFKGFREERIAKIYADEGFIKQGEGAKAILHIIPISSFSFQERLNVGILYEQLRLGKVPHLLGGNGFDHRINLDGILLHSNINDQGRCKSYLQLFNNGIIEAVSESVLTSGIKTIPSKKFEVNIINATVQCIGYLKGIGIEMPYIVCLTLVGVDGYKMAASEFIFDNEGAIDRDVLLIPEILFEEDVINSDVPKHLKPLIDSVWNACGFMKL